MSFDKEESINESFDQKIKIMILGESSVGKTSLITRYTKDTFCGLYLTTVGIDFQEKFLNINNKKIKIEIWDTAGQERYRNISKNYFQSSDGFLLAYDITNEDSFQKLSFWHEQIHLNAPEKTKYIVVGNKKDIEDKRKVQREEGENFAKNNGVHFYETSALDSTNVNVVFEFLAKEIVNDQEKIGIQNKRCSQILQKKKTKTEKKNCC